MLLQALVSRSLSSSKVTALDFPDGVYYVNNLGLYLAQRKIGVKRMVGS
jgi:hypothetical protein